MFLKTFHNDFYLREPTADARAEITSMPIVQFWEKPVRVTPHSGYSLAYFEYTVPATGATGQFVFYLDSGEIYKVYPLPDPVRAVALTWASNQLYLYIINYADREAFRVVNQSGQSKFYMNLIT